MTFAAGRGWRCALGRLLGIVLSVGPALACRSNPEAGPERRMVTVQWDTVWQTSSAFMDSVLPAPALMTFNRGRLFVFDRALAQLVALDPNTGALLWKVGRLGQGPEEFAGVSALFLDRAGGVGVVDSRNGRIARVDPLGQFISLVPTGTVGHQVGQVCAFGESQFVAADVFSPSLIMMDSTGALIRTLSPIWPDLVDLPSIDSRLVLLWNDEAGKRCLVALLTGRGFALLSAAQEPTLVSYVERFDVYGVGERQGEGEVAFTAVFDAEFVADTVTILFTGRTEDRARLLDRYSGVSGEYLGTYLLPFKTVEFAAGGRLVFALDPSETGIVAVRPRR